MQNREIILKVTKEKYHVKHKSKPNRISYDFLMETLNAIGPGQMS